MLSALVEFSIRFRVVVLAAAMALIFFGAAELRRMPVDVLPEFSPPLVEIQTEALGLSAAEVETMVTLSLEELVLGLPWLKSLRSESVAGLSSIRLEFEAGTPLMRARQMVQERLTTAFLLPNVAKPPIMQQPVSSTNRVLMVALSSKDLDPIALSVLTQWTVKPKLLGVPGVARVAIWGERKRQLQVQVDPEAMRKNGITLRQVISSTGDSLWVSHLSFLRSSVPGTGGYLDTTNQRMEIRHILPVSSPADLARISIDGSKLKLGDVADVVEGHPPLIGDAMVESGQGLLLVIEKFPGVNALEVTRAVEAALEDLRPGMSGVKIDSQAFRPASFVEWSMANLAKVGLAALLFVTLAMAALLRSWRALIIGLVTIPVALTAATLVLHARGATANALMLAGFGAALAIIIDDLVVAGESLARRLAQRGGRPFAGHEQGSIIHDSSLEGRRSLLFALLVSLLAVAPLMFLEGRAGTFLQPLAWSYGLALVASLAVTLTVVPAFAAVLSGWGPRQPASPAPTKMMAAVVAALATPFWPAMVLVQLLVVTAAVGFVVYRGGIGGADLLPRFDERDMVIHWEAAPGTSREEMVRAMTKAAGDLRAIPGVRSVNAHIGRAISGDQTVGINSGRFWVRADPEGNFPAILAGIQSALTAYPNVQHRIHSYLNDRLGNTLAGGGQTFTVRVFGQRREPLQEVAAQVREALGRVDGLWDVRVDGVPMEAQIQVVVDLTKAAQIGIKPGDVRRAASTLFAGLEVGQIFESQKVFEVVVWSKPEARRSVESIANALIELPAGGHVRLADVAAVTIVPTPSVVKREDISQYADIIGTVRGRSTGAIAADVRERLRSIDFKLGYYPQILGHTAGSDTLSKPALVVAGAAAAGILLLLQAAFGSWQLAAAVALLLPLGLSGGALAALLVDGRLSLGAVLGLLAVYSLAVRQAMALNDRSHAIARDTSIAGGHQTVSAALSERLPAVIVASLCVAIAVCPMLYFSGQPGLELLAPMAIAVLGGLVTSSMLVIFVLPAVLAHLGGAEADLDLDRAPNHGGDSGSGDRALGHVARQSEPTQSVPPMLPLPVKPEFVR